MGQFKPMVKMMTTEPSVELKLKKGGSVKKADGGMMGAPAPAMPSAMPARGGSMPAAAPAKPSMMARRRAMKGLPAGAGPAAPVGMAARMMKEGGESKAEHKAEMAKMAKTSKMLKEHADKPASKAHKGLKTGGVVNGQGGFKAGGIINTENQGGAYRNTKMHDGEKTDRSPAKTGGVKMGNAGGYATGGVAKANGGGYKKGGAAKKAYATGGLVDDGRPVAMPQGRKPAPKPVSITALSGTYKAGGKVAPTPAQKRLQKTFEEENKEAMRDSKRNTREKYAEGGDVIPSEAREQLKTNEMNRAYKNWEKSEREENEAMRGAILGAPKRMMEGIKGMFSKKAPEGSVTKTEKSVTVTPAKKRGGRVC